MLANTGCREAGLRHRAIDRRRHAARIEALGDPDEVDHRVAHAVRPVDVEPVGLDGERAGADQQVAEPGARGDAGVPVMCGVAREHVGGGAGLAGGEHP